MRSALILLAASAGLIGAPSKPVANYDIKAKLDTKAHTVTASEVIEWLNDSKDTVPALQFHLYMNAFKNSKSTFFKESRGQLRGDKFKGDEWGWVDVKKMQIVGGADLTKAIRFIQPDDGNKDDQTVIEVALPEPVKPGGTIRVAIDFVTKVPMVYARTGFHKDFYLIGQWFPKLGVWETAGVRYSKQGAWNCHQFHANSEFYANFGNYRAELTVPAGNVIGGTGEMTRRAENPDKTVTYTFEQSMVTDFVWTVQPTFLREERMFIADKETTPAEVAQIAKLHGIPEGEARLSDVKMIALVQPEHREQIDRHFTALRNALKYFGLWYGKYPYKTITVLDPPYGAGGAGGMEYPTFITAGTSWRQPEEVHSLEMVTVHEFGHQFWMELVASNEFEESWLDEGFNTYSTTKVMDKVYGPSAMHFRFFLWNLWKLLKLPRHTEESLNRTAYVVAPMEDDLVRRAWEYYDSTSYGVNSYMRTSVTLATLEGILGADTMSRVMRAYHQRWRFNHPSSRDFQAVVNEASGRNMDWFFDQFVFGNRVIDYSVGEVANTEQKSALGVFDDTGKRITVTRKDADEKDKKLAEDKNRKKQYECVVNIRRLGDGVSPVDVHIHFKDGKLEKRTWDGQYRWVKYTFLRDSEIDWVEVDPGRKHQLDINYANNSWISQYQKEVSASWGAQLLFWFQNCMLWVTAIA